MRMSRPLLAPVPKVALFFLSARRLLRQQRAQTFRIARRRPHQRVGVVDVVDEDAAAIDDSAAQELAQTARSNQNAQHLAAQSQPPTVIEFARPGVGPASLREKQKLSSTSAASGPQEDPRAPRLAG